MNGQVKRTTCIKAQKWPPTKLTHIIMNNSCVVPLTETGMDVDDRHYILRQNGVQKLCPLSYFHTEKITLSWCMFVSCYCIFLFETVLIIHMAYKVFQ